MRRLLNIVSYPFWVAMILTILTHTANGCFYSSKKNLRSHLPQKSLGTSVPSLMNLGSDLTAIGVATGGSSAPCPEESTLAPSTSSNEMRSQSSTLLSSCWQMPSFSHLLSVHVEYLRAEAGHSPLVKQVQRFMNEGFCLQLVVYQEIRSPITANGTSTNQALAVPTYGCV